MEKKYGRSFIGYKPSDVRSKIHQENMTLEKENMKHSRELSKLIEENKSLKEELQNLKASMASYKELRSKLEGKLYNTHMDSCRIVYDAHKKYEEMIKGKIELMQVQESKNLEVKSSINKLLNEIHLFL
jgi:predicted  nucleic acid-binding Zn-ribbon protein